LHRAAFLTGEDEALVGDQLHTERQALQLSGGEGGHAAVCETSHLQRLEGVSNDARSAAGAELLGRGAQRDGEVQRLADGGGGQVRVKLLGEGASTGHGQGGGIHAVQLDAAGDAAGRLAKRQNIQQCRLAGAGAVGRRERARQAGSGWSWCRECRACGGSE